jgi:hypothetical protein
MRFAGSTRSLRKGTAGSTGANKSAGYKIQRGARLGASSEAARQEGFAVQETARKALEEAIATQKKQQQDSQIADLRKQLGIDDLINNLQQNYANAQESFGGQLDLRGGDAGYAEGLDYGAQEDGGAEQYLDDYISDLVGESEVQTETQIETTPETATSVNNKNVLKVANTNINLAKRGGTGLDLKDITYLKNKGLSNTQIIQAVRKADIAPNKAAQKVLGIKATPAQDGGVRIQKTESQQQQKSAPTFFASPQAVATAAPKQQKTESRQKAANAAPAKAAAPAPAPAPTRAPAPAPTPAPAPAPARAPAANRGREGGGGDKGGGGGSAGKKK